MLDGCFSGRTGDNDKRGVGIEVGHKSQGRLGNEERDTDGGGGTWGD